MLKRPDFKVGSDTLLIINLMKERMHESDSLVTHHELERLTGKPLREIRGLIGTARRHIRREHGIWYGNIPALGYRVVPHEDLHHCGKSNRAKARNLHRETIKILDTADPSKQSAQARTSTILEMSVAELGMAATAPRAISKAEQIVSRSHNELTFEEQIEAIKDALKPKK